MPLVQDQSLDFLTCSPALPLYQGCPPLHPLKYPAYYRPRVTCAISRTRLGALGGSARLSFGGLLGRGGFFFLAVFGDTGARPALSALACSSFPRFSARSLALDSRSVSINITRYDRCIRPPFCTVRLYWAGDNHHTLATREKWCSRFTVLPCMVILYW